MWNHESDSDVALRAIVGALVLGADHPLTPAELHKIVEDVELARRAQSADAPDVSDAELAAVQAEADIAAGRAVSVVPKAEADAARDAALAARAAGEKKASAAPPSKICPPSEIRKAVSELRERLAKADIGFELAEVMGKGRATTLSRPAVETLAIIAWRQPVSRSEIESVRGVNAGHVVKALMEMQLVRIVGRSDLPGRPFLFGTTPAFLEHFGLKSLDDLDAVEGASELSRDRGDAKKPEQAQFSMTVK